MRKRQKRFHFLLCLVLVGLMVVPQQGLLGLGQSVSSPVSSSYLAPRTITDSPEAVLAQIRSGLEWAYRNGKGATVEQMATLFSGEVADQDLLNKFPSLKSIVLSGLARAQELGLQIEVEQFTDELDGKTKLRIVSRNGFQKWVNYFPSATNVASLYGRNQVSVGNMLRYLIGIGSDFFGYLTRQLKRALQPALGKVPQFRFKSV